MRGSVLRCSSNRHQSTTSSRLQISDPRHGLRDQFVLSKQNISLLKFPKTIRLQISKLVTQDSSKTGQICETADITQNKHLQVPFIWCAINAKI